MRELLSRLLTPRNILPIVVILAAIIGTFDASFFGASVKPEQIILALLALLAIDALVERLDLLTSIEKEVKQTNSLLAPKVSADLFFQKQDLRNVAEIIDNTHTEFWVYGLTLDGLLTLVGQMRQKIIGGCRVKILAPDPKGTAFEEIAKYTGSRKEPLVQRLESNLEYLSVLATSLAKNAPAGSAQIRVVDQAILTGFVISDPNSKSGHMLLRPYLYWFGTAGAPIIELFRDREKEWFDIYTNQFMKAWEHAEEYIPPTKQTGI